MQITIQKWEIVKVLESLNYFLFLEELGMRE